MYDLNLMNLWKGEGKKEGGGGDALIVSWLKVLNLRKDAKFENQMDCSSGILLGFYCL